MKIRAIIALVVCLGFALSAVAQDRSVVMSYKTDSAPTIDGELGDGEWDAAGPWITVTENSPNAQAGVDLIEDDAWGGDGDLSYRFKTMWQEDTANFFLLYEVFDDIAMDTDPQNLWERDQIETFIDGTNIEGDENLESFQWWSGSETYGKLGVSRYNTFEGNSAKMTDDEFFWDDGFDGTIISLSAAKELETNADYRVELAVSLIPMIDDAINAPFAGTPTDDALTIVEDSTQVKFTVAVSDDDNFSTGETERSSVITYYRERDGEDADWRDSPSFADLVFTGEFDGSLVPEPVVGDCNGDGVLNPADLDACTTTELLSESLEAQGLIPGDFDANGTVEFPDFLTLSANFGQPGTYSQGNADGVGNVEFPDFLILSATFGQSSAAEAAAVPEPSTGLLFSMGLGVAALLRRRRS